ncbi:hypothetical protein [Marinilactibacillus psychrotolerans]|uniref:hypothetical protein n=1 Tax=Marinilactibacillus psychrotolerans TaxID=191770 RepID=UPI0038896D69
MEEEKNKVLNNERIKNRGMDFVKKAKEFNSSIKEHLTPEYRKQFNIRRFFSCILLFVFIRSWDYTYGPFSDTILSTNSILPLIYSTIAWKFWHYAYWSFQGGVIDNLSKSIIYIGSFWGVLGKLFLQNFLILIWIALIAPFSGINTWLKAVKLDKVLFYGNEKW